MPSVGERITKMWYNHTWNVNHKKLIKSEAEYSTDTTCNHKNQ